MADSFCPGCGHRTYQHTADGCTKVEQIHHIASVTADGVTIKHPIAEREEDRLFECTVLNEVMSVSYRVNEGCYAIIHNRNGGWSFEPQDKASEPCGCTRSYPTPKD